MGEWVALQTGRQTGRQAGLKRGTGGGGGVYSSVLSVPRLALGISFSLQSGINDR